MFERCVSIEFPVQWCTGAPRPFLFMNEHRTFLTFYVRESGASWDEINSEDLQANKSETIALVQFFGCASAKLGAPNDEVFHGHPLFTKGLEYYSAQEVLDSSWLKQLEEINSVHGSYNPARWRNLHHYVFWFHDSTFECIAESFKVEVHGQPMEQTLELVYRRMLD